MAVRHRGDKWIARAYVGGRHVHIGTFDTKPEATRAHDDYLAEHRDTTPTDCKQFAKRWMTDYPRPKASTREVNEQRVRQFGKDFAGTNMNGPFSRSPYAKKAGKGGSPDRVIARAWANEHPHELPAVRAMFNDALNDGLIRSNPFAKLGLKQSRGRKDIVPPSVEEVGKLVKAAHSVHGETYGPVFAAQIMVAAYTGVRPGELWELRWSDVDLRRLEVTVARRTWNGDIDAPKNGRSRKIILPPPARDALLAAPRHVNDDLLFLSKRGKPMTKGTHVYSWHPVRSAIGRPDMDFYELRHFCATYLLELGLSPADVALQLGHTDGGRLVQNLYGHPSEDLARERLKRAFQTNVAELRSVDGEAANG